MLIKKILIYLFLSVIFLIAVQRIIVNVIYFNKTNLNTGVVTKTDVHADTDGYSSRHSYTLKDSNENSFDGIYGDKANYSISINDTIAFRKLYNGSVREIKLNGNQIQDYYGLWDYGSIITVLIYVLFLLAFPKLKKIMKKSEQKRISEILKSK